MNGPVSISGTERISLVAARGQSYDILLAHPPEPPPPEGYPAIFLLDANATFGTFVEAIRLRAARPDVTGVIPTAIVGIGYPGARPYDRARRTFDYTAAPAASPRPGGASQKGPGAVTGEVGGADAFLQFMTGEVRTTVAGRLPLDPLRLSLFGHSLGGYFVLRTLLTTPASFQGYVAASPSIWWDREGLMQAAAALPQSFPAAASTRVMLTVGEYEQKLSATEAAHPGSEVTAARRQARTMVDSTRQLAGRLAAHDLPGLDVRFEEFAQEDHASSVLRTIGACLRFLLAPR